MSDDLLKALKNSVYLAFDDGTNDYTTALKAAEHIEELEAELEGRKKLMLTLAGDKIDLVSELAGVKFELAKAVEAMQFWKDAVESDVDKAIALMDATLAELTKERSDEKGD